MPFPRTREGTLVQGDVLWGRVNTCRADCSVSCRVGGAAVALIIVGLDDLRLYYTHILSAVTGPLDLSLSHRTYVPCRGAVGVTASSEAIAGSGPFDVMGNAVCTYTGGDDRTR